MTTEPYKEEVAIVVGNLSEIIRRELACLAGEWWEPHFQADQMDTEIAYRKRRIEFLRKMRQDFEDQMFGMAKNET